MLSGIPTPTCTILYALQNYQTLEWFLESLYHEKWGLNFSFSLWCYHTALLRTKQPLMKNSLWKTNSSSHFMFMSSRFQVFLVHYYIVSLTGIDRAANLNQLIQLMGWPTAGSSATLSCWYVSELKSSVILDPNSMIQVLVSQERKQPAPSLGTTSFWYFIFY